MYHPYTLLELARLQQAEMIRGAERRALAARVKQNGEPRVSFLAHVRGLASSRVAAKPATIQPA